MGVLVIIIREVFLVSSPPGLPIGSSLGMAFGNPLVSPLDYPNLGVFIDHLLGFIYVIILGNPTG